MRKSHREQEDVIEEESSDNENFLLCHMNSVGLYPTDNTLVDKRNIKNEITNSNAHSGSIISNFVTNKEKNLDDSLDEDNMTGKGHFNKSLSQSFEDKNKKFDLKKKKIEYNNNLSDLNISSDRHVMNEYRLNTDEEAENELRINSLKKNKSTRAVEIKSNLNKNIKKEEISKYDDNEEKYISLNESKFRDNTNNYIGNDGLKSSMISYNNTMNNNLHTNSDGPSMLHADNSLKKLPIVHSSMQYQPTPYPQYIQSNHNQFNNQIDNSFIPHMNPAYNMPNLNNQYMQNNMPNPYQFNQYACNPNQYVPQPNNPYINQAQQQPFAYNMNIPPSSISPQEFMQMKVNLTNLESENFALKHKLNELNKNPNRLKEKDISAIAKENYQLKLVIETLTIDKLALQEELEDFRKNNTDDKLEHIELNYNMIIKSKDELLKKNKEEIEKLKSTVDYLKKDILKYKSTNNNLDNENNCLKEELSELESQILTLNKKIEGGNLNFRNLREDFDNLTKKFHLLKHEYDYTANILSECKSDNNYLKKEIEILNRKTVTSDKMNRSTVVENMNDKINGGVQNKLEANISQDEFSDNLQSSRQKARNEEVHPNKETNLHINRLQQKISELMNEKSRVENELFKMPDKAKSMNIIHKQKSLEETLQSVETDINKFKTKIRELKHQLR